MFKLDLEKAEEPEIKLPTSVGSLDRCIHIVDSLCCTVETNTSLYSNSVLCCAVLSCSVVSDSLRAHGRMGKKSK